MAKLVCGLTLNPVILKQFLKSDWRKIVIFIPLSIVFAWEVGIPLRSTIPVGEISNVPLLDPINLVINLIFWYLFSCLIIWIYDKLKKKS